jgi:lipopolysaccharide/colanic/teichoic acid biosynthesis glycosyltransferase
VKTFKPEFENSSAGASKATRPRPFQKFSSHKSIRGFSGFAKRALDLSGAAAGLVCLSPLMALIAILVRLSDGGSVLYRQTRVGLHGHLFTMIKFRTMVEDAERELGAIWSVPHDPRCTRLGYYLRRSGLDELPQLWNVLRGEMSLVGPRPERPEFISEFRKEHRDYDVRHMVRVGLTGYAQIHGWRGFTSVEERLRHDKYYVRNWSLRLDLYIVLMTFFRGCSERTRAGV